MKANNGIPVCSAPLRAIHPYISCGSLRKGNVRHGIRRPLCRAVNVRPVVELVENLYLERHLRNRVPFKK